MQTAQKEQTSQRSYPKEKNSANEYFNEALVRETRKQKQLSLQPITDITTIFVNKRFIIS